MTKLGPMITTAPPTYPDFDSAVEAFRRDGLPNFLQGNHAATAAHFSTKDDVTLANPLGLPVRSFPAVAQAAAAAASQLSGGSMLGVEEVSRYSTADLGYVVQIERAQARLAGSQEVSRISLRVTMIFRREDDGWKVVHRHADPITAPRAVSSIIES